VCGSRENTRPLQQNQFSGEAAENPVDIPAESGEKSRKRASAERIALSCVRSDKTFAISDLTGLPKKVCTRTGTPASGGFFFHTCKRLPD